MRERRRLHVHVGADAVAGEALHNLRRQESSQSARVESVGKRRRARRARLLAPNPAFSAPAAMMCPIASKGTPGPHAAKNDDAPTAPSCTRTTRATMQKQARERPKLPADSHLQWPSSCSRGCTPRARARRAPASRRRTCGSCRRARRSRSCAAGYQREQRCLMRGARGRTR